MTAWTSLYLISDDAQSTATQLLGLLQNHDYKPYDPFGTVPGRSYPHPVKTFVAPAVDGWVRVLGDYPLLAKLSESHFVLHVALAVDAVDISVFVDGAQHPTPADALEAHLRPGKTRADLEHALSTPDIVVIDPEKPDGLPMDVLPDDVQQLAGDVDGGQANKMFQRLTGQLLGGSADADAARGLLAQGGPNWNSAAGARLITLMELLTVPENWRQPSFEALRDAYSLHNRRMRRPNARLYPGDAEAMAAVPDALNYIPVYAGKEA